MRHTHTHAFVCMYFCVYIHAWEYMINFLCQCYYICMHVPHKHRCCVKFIGSKCNFPKRIRENYLYRWVFLFFFSVVNIIDDFQTVWEGHMFVFIYDSNLLKSSATIKYFILYFRPTTLITTTTVTTTLQLSV